MIAFILVSTVAAKEHLVYEDLLKLSYIKEIVPLFGEWDLHLRVEGESDEISKWLEQIRYMSNICDVKILHGMRF